MDMHTHPVVSREEWLTQRLAHLAEERKLTHARDALAEQRRSLPWVRVDKAYVFDGPIGKVTLADLFAGRSQLIIQHFMLAPGEAEGCIGCSFMADHVDAARQHFERDDLSFAAVARAPIAEIEAYRKRMGWGFAWVSSLASDFNFDFQVSFTPEQVASGAATYNYRVGDVGMEDLPGVSVFFKDTTGTIFHTYSSFARGGEPLIGAYSYLDLTPKGRNETGPRGNLMDWVRRHDSYDEEKTASCCAD